MERYTIYTIAHVEKAAWRCGTSTLPPIIGSTFWKRRRLSPSISNRSVFVFFSLGNTRPAKTRMKVLFQCCHPANDGAQTDKDQHKRDGSCREIKMIDSHFLYIQGAVH